jgi:hypothetical protein
MGRGNRIGKGALSTVSREVVIHCRIELLGKIGNDRRSLFLLALKVTFLQSVLRVELAMDLVFDSTFHGFGSWLGLLVGGAGLLKASGI